MDEVPGPAPSPGSDPMSRGLQAQQAGYLYQAEQCFREALAVDPADAEAWRRIGQISQTLGNLEAALTCYRKAVEVKPDHADALMDLGVALATRGDLEAALVEFRRAADARPESGHAHNNIGTVLTLLGRPADAVPHYREALSRQPDFPQFLSNLSKVLNDTGATDEAVAVGRRAVEQRPDAADARHNLGAALATARQWPEAAAEFEEAVRLAPGFAEALLSLGKVRTEQGRLDDAESALARALGVKPNWPAAALALGVLRNRQGRPDEAMPVLREVIRVLPGEPAARAEAGRAAAQLGRLEEALDDCREAVRLKPKSADAHLSLGVVQRRRGALAEAEAALREALGLEPKSPAALVTLGNVLVDQIRMGEAAERYDQALAISPDHPEAHLNRALLWLRRGDYERGWPEYEWRWKCPVVKPRAVDAPRWDGAPLEGRTILLQFEQGLGDLIQFVRYAPLVKDRGGRVLLECPAAVHPVLATCAGIDRLVSPDEPFDAVGPVDTHAPLMSLPALLKTKLGTVPAKVPYLTADAARVDQWRDRLTGKKYRVGVVWRGNPRHPHDHLRSFPLAAFEPVASLDGVEVVALQKGAGAAEAAALGGRFQVTDLGERLDPDGGISDLAAVLMSLDLVIACDTAVAHLAGALARPVWVVLSRVADWRWLLEHETSPWYPTMRIFRQTTLNDWGELFRRVARAVRQHVGTRVREKLLIEIGPGELIDRICRLEAELGAGGQDGRATVAAELERLAALRQESVTGSDELTRLTAELKTVHQALRKAGDELRQADAGKIRGSKLADLARAFARDEEHRRRLGERIDELFGGGT